MGIAKASILLIYTGGTIGMKQDVIEQTLVPFDFDQILEEVPELKKFTLRVDSYTFDPLIDSSDVEPAIWIKLAQLIKEKYEDYDGFIILHGTDTMSYSASALSFMLDGLTKPVVFTGSQLPIGAPRTDGKENLILAVEIASARNEDGHPIIPEVCVCFDSLIMRGNRSIKIDAEVFRAFVSPNYPPLAEAGIDIKYNKDFIRKPLDWYQDLSINTKLDTRVGILKIHPGMTHESTRYLLLDPNIRAIILETYGAGNAPTKDWFINLINEANNNGKVIVNVTQCISGKVNMNLYANGKALAKAGVINGYDSTTEAILTKLYYLLGKSNDNSWVKEMLTRNLKGEISK